MAGKSPVSVLFDELGNPVTVVVDPNDGRYRLSVDGKVSVVLPTPPGAAVTTVVEASNPLTVTGFHETSVVIPTGKTFYLTQVVFGATGDPREAGSKVELFYDNGTRHVVDRYYVTGFTQFITYPEITETRDGTIMVGTGTETLIVRRERLETNSALEIDAVVRGYFL